MTRLLTTIALTALLLTACGGDDAADTTPVATEPAAEAAAAVASEPEAMASSEPAAATEPAEAMTEEAPGDDPRAADADALAATFDGVAFPFDAQTEENAPLFTYLAATGEDPALVAGALRGMAATHRAVEVEGYVLVDDEYAEVVLTHLVPDADPAVLLAAIDAGATLFNLDAGPDARVRDAMIAAAEAVGDPALTTAVVDEIWQADWETDPAISAFMLDAVSSGDPVLTTSALFRVETANAFTLAARSAFVDAILPLVGAPDPVVHGSALQALGNLAREIAGDPRVDAIQSGAEAGLAHADVYVRGSAVTALEGIGRLSAVPLLIGVLGDVEEGALGSVSTTAYDGTQTSVGYDVSPWSTVTDAALVAISSLTSGTPYHFDYFGYDIDPSLPTPVDDQILAVAAEAEAWFAANAAAIEADAAAQA